MIKILGHKNLYLPHLEVVVLEAKSSTFLDPYTFGLFKSTDGGTSFSKITSVNNGAGISKLEEINDLEVQEVSNRLDVNKSKYLGRVFWGKILVQ